MLIFIFYLQLNIVNNLQEEVTNQTNEIAELKENVRELGHVETGSESFGKSDTWILVGPDNKKIKYAEVYFKSAYQEPPSILLSVTGLDMDTNYNIRHGCVVFSKGIGGFTIKCHCWNDSYYYDVIVNWMSVPGDYN